MKAELDIAWAEGNKLWAEVDKLRAEVDKLWAEHDKLRAEANKLWYGAVHRICGPDVSIEWLDSGGCIVAGVMEFLPLWILI